MADQNKAGYYNPSVQPMNVMYPMYAQSYIPVQKKKSPAGKTAIISIILTVVIIFSGVSVFALGAGVNSSADSGVPSGGKVVDSGYEEDSAVAQAPSVKADPNGPQISTTETPAVDSGESKTASEVYEKAYRCIVCITSYDKDKDYITSADGEGSGIVLTEDGYIATNSHVVNDSTKTGVLVTMYDETQYLGTIIGIDKKTDLAVIKIEAKGLNYAEFADSEKLKIGELSFALGNPGGSEFSNSLTKGTVSAINRTLSGSAHIKYIQTDAAINPGNSGGALLNEFGQVIGMNTAKLVATDYEGMGFAIPSNTVIEIVNKLIKYGYVNDRGTIGIEGKTCDLYMSKVNNVPQGMIVTKIDPKGSAADTDLKVNDIITRINDVKVKSSYELIDELKKYKPNDKITLRVYRPSQDKNSKGYSFDVKIRLKKDTGTENK